MLQLKPHFTTLTASSSGTNPESSNFVWNWITKGIRTTLTQPLGNEATRYSSSIRLLRSWRRSEISKIRIRIQTQNQTQIQIKSNSVTQNSRNWNSISMNSITDIEQYVNETRSSSASVLASNSNYLERERERERSANRPPPGYSARRSKADKPSNSKPTKLQWEMECEFVLAVLRETTPSSSLLVLILLHRAEPWRPLAHPGGTGSDQLWAISKLGHSSHLASTHCIYWWINLVCLLVCLYVCCLNRMGCTLRWKINGKYNTTSCLNIDLG